MNANSSSKPMKQLEENSRLGSLQGAWFKRGLVGLSVRLVTLGGIGTTCLAIIIARERCKFSPPLVNVEPAHLLIDGYIKPLN